MSASKPVWARRLPVEDAKVGDLYMRGTGKPVIIEKVLDEGDAVTFRFRYVLNPARTGEDAYTKGRGHNLMVPGSRLFCAEDRTEYWYISYPEDFIDGLMELAELAE